MKKDNDNLKILSPSLFLGSLQHKALKTTDTTASIEIAYGEFLNNIFKDEGNINLFEDSETNSLIKLINSVSIDKNVKRINSKQPKTICKLPFIKDLFIEDINYLRENEDMFLDKLPLFLQYYLMFYCSQLTLRFNLQFKINEQKNSATEIYYILDDERLSSTRQAKIQGYNTIATASTNLYENIILLSALNYIFDEELKTFYELKQIYMNYDELTKEEILITLQEWIILFNKSMNYQYKYSDLKDFDSACNVFYNMIGHGKSYKAQRSRYALSLEDLLYQFSKLHGNQGHSMSLTQDNLIFFIRLSTKGNRMKIKNVFKEMEKRGIFFDSRTKTQVIEKLDQLNMIDSVSDSGDAKYVKEF
jgi:DNA phosphorothioation-dependent restriction protein DptG